MSERFISEKKQSYKAICNPMEIIILISDMISASNNIIKTTRFFDAPTKE